MYTPYTKEELDDELTRLVTRLPMAELMLGGAIKLQGANGFFNPNSLIDPNWLQGKITSEDYRNAIDYINTCTAYTHIGLSRVYAASERKFREDLRTQAGSKAVEELNQRHKSVRFTYQMTAENIQMNVNWSNDPAVQFATRHKSTVGNATVYHLYITFP